jgi:hypothetical protein
MVLILVCVFCNLVSGDTHYYAIFLNNQKCGYCVQSRDVKQDIVKTSENVNLTINRFGIPITVETLDKTTETIKGEPLSFKSVQNMSMMSTRISGTIEPNGFVNISTSSMGSSYEKTIKWDEQALMPEGLRQIQMEKGLIPATSYKVKVFAPQLVQAVQTEITIGQKQNVNVLGEMKELYKVTSKTQIPSAGEITTTSFVDDALVMHKSTMPFMNMQLELVKCTEETAYSEIIPVEIAIRSFIPSPADLKNLQNAAKGTYVLKLTDVNETLTLPETLNQKVIPLTSGGAKVIVQNNDIPTSRETSKKVNGNMDKYLAPNRYLQSNNPEIINLAQKAVGNVTNPGKAAEKIETFVADYITKSNLSVGYASAVEIMKNKSGDCSEFAVLTAALCRATGIPARVAVGIAYVDEFAGLEKTFGGHAWTQVLIDGNWYDLDAAFKSTGRSGFDCGHIVFTTGGGNPEDFLTLLKTIGKIKIESAEIRF